MRSLRFNPSLLYLMGLALLGALFLPPTFGGWVRSAMTAAVFPVSRTVRSLAESVHSRVSEPRRSISETHNNSKTNDQLQNELETLKSQYLALQVENDDLRTRLDERKDWPKDLLKLCRVVQVVGGDMGNQPALTLQPGAPENPVSNAPVLTSYDIVGRLEIVGPGASKVVLITSPARVVRGELTHYHADGSGIERLHIVLTFRGDGAGHLRVTTKLSDLQRPGNPRQLKFDLGDRVILTDADWPSMVQGFTLGEIESYDDKTKPLFCTIVIRPRLDLMQLKEVMVLK